MGPHNKSVSPNKYDAVRVRGWFSVAAFGGFTTYRSADAVVHYAVSLPFALAKTKVSARRRKSLSPPANARTGRRSKFEAMLCS